MLPCTLDFRTFEGLPVGSEMACGGRIGDVWVTATRRVIWGYGQDKHETHSGPASPCVEALARPRRRVWPPEGLPVL